VQNAQIVSLAWQRPKWMCGTKYLQLGITDGE